MPGCSSLLLSQYNLGIGINGCCICLCFNIFESVFQLVQMATALPSCKRRRDVCSEASLITSQPRSLNDLPDEIILKILTHIGPEDLCLIIAKVCERWNILSKDIILWKKLSYHCYHFSDISRIKEVRCIAFLEFRTNYLWNIAQFMRGDQKQLELFFKYFIKFYAITTLVSFKVLSF